MNIKNQRQTKGQYVGSRLCPDQSGNSHSGFKKIHCGNEDQALATHVNYRGCRCSPHRLQRVGKNVVDAEQKACG